MTSGKRLAIIPEPFFVSGRDDDHRTMPGPLAKLSDRAARVYLILALHEGPGGCYPSLEEIAKLAGRDVATVKRGLEDLVDAGLVEKQPGGGRGRSTRYTLKAGANLRSAQTKKGAQPCAPFEAERGEKRAQQRSKTGAAVKTNGRSCDAKLAQPCAPKDTGTSSSERQLGKTPFPGRPLDGGSATGAGGFGSVDRSLSDDDSNPFQGTGGRSRLGSRQDAEQALKRVHGKAGAGGMNTGVAIEIAQDPRVPLEAIATWIAASRNATNPAGYIRRSYENEIKTQDRQARADEREAMTAEQDRQRVRQTRADEMVERMSDEEIAEACRTIAERGPNESIPAREREVVQADAKGGAHNPAWVRKPRAATLRLAIYDAAQAQAPQGMNGRRLNVEGVREVKTILPAAPRAPTP